MLVSDSQRRKADFVRLIKEPMSRDWVEKDRLLDLQMRLTSCVLAFLPLPAIDPLALAPRVLTIATGVGSSF